MYYGLVTLRIGKTIFNYLSSSEQLCLLPHYLAVISGAHLQECGNLELLLSHVLGSIQL